MQQTILITGGTGFLGKQFAIALRDSATVVLCARDKKRNVAASRETGCDVVPLDVVNMESVRDAVVRVKPDVIIHAAATKSVDRAERHPMECIDINVIGSQNVARVAVDRRVRTVIGISTIKAAPPVRNTYGLTKALMERMYCSMNDNSETRFVCVRYGNVPWSTGSVLPIWKRMHDTSGVIGTTGPEMRRIFFTVDEAVQLVLTAMEHADELQGKVVSRHMKAAEIGDILRIWVDNFGGRWERITGRPDEREDEILIGDQEVPHTKELIYDEVPHYVISFNEKVTTPLARGLSSANAERLTDGEILRLLTERPMEGMQG